MEWLEPSVGLQTTILKKIARAKKLSLIRKLIFDCIACLAFFSLGVYASIGTWQAFNSSSFNDLVSLMWSDLPGVVTYWQDFSYSLLEVLPATTIFILGLASTSLLFFAHDLLKRRTELSRV